MNRLHVFGLFLLLFAAPFTFASPESITVCKGEPAIFEYELANQGEPLTYSISSSGISGSLSITKVSLGRGEAASFTFTIQTADKAAGSYPFTITADGNEKVSKASSVLTVSDCYGSLLAVNPTAVTVEKCSSAKVQVTVQNTGSKSDSYSLSSSGDLAVNFSRQILGASASGSSSTDAYITAPCSAQPGTRTVQITSSGKTKKSATVTVYVTAPTPTPAPSGCAYSNPSCTSPKVCQNNACVLPPGCKYSNPACASGFYCDNSTNSCMQAAKPAAPVITSKIQYDVCRGETVKYDYSLANPATTAQTYALKVNGVTSATISPSSSLYVPASQSTPFAVTVDTAQVTSGAYNFNVTASNANNIVFAASGLTVRTCYASSASLSASGMTLCPTQAMTRTITVRNRGSESDIFILNATASSDTKVEFSPDALLVPAGESRTALVVVTAPSSYNPSGESRIITVSASGNSISSAQVSVSLTRTASCPSAYSPTMFLSAVRACKGEVARFKFAVFNPETTAQEFAVNASSPVNGRLSASSLRVPANSSENVYYSVNTSEVALGSYPITLSAGNGKSSGSVATQLQVDDCFVSNLTLVSATSGNETLPITFPSAVPTIVPTVTVKPTAVATATAKPTVAANASAVPSAKPTVAANASTVPSAVPTAAVNASANATNVTAKPAGVLWAILPQGLVLEAGLQKNITVTLRNSADYEITSVRILISNMTVSDIAIPSIAAGKSLTVDLLVSTVASRPFNATVRAIGEQGSGETVFMVNATEGKVAARTFKSAATTVNGTNGSVERVNTTVRLYNYANEAANLTVAMREPSVNLSTANVSIPAKSYAEITLLSQIPKGKNYNATLFVTTKNGTVYSLPVSLRAVSASASTGMFSGSLVSMFSLAVVAIGVILVLFYFARRNSEDDEDEEDSEENEPADTVVEEKPKEEEKKQEKARKPAKKR